MVKPTIVAVVFAVGITAVLPTAENAVAQKTFLRSQKVSGQQVRSQNAFAAGDQLHGIAKPSQLAELPSLVPGTISIVHVQEGEFVKKGAPLITLDDRVPKARLQAATVEANLTGALRRAQVEHRMANRRLERLRTAVSRSAGANFEIEEAEGVLDQAAAAVQQQQDVLKAAEANRQLAAAQLDQYTVSAPFDGRIIRIHQKSGAVDPSQQLVIIANLETLEVDMHISSSSYGNVSTGQTIKLNAAAPVSGVVNARVLSVSPMINSASNTFRCRLQIANSNSRHPAGFSVVLQDSDFRNKKVAMFAQ